MLPNRVFYVPGSEHGSPPGSLSEQLNKLKDELLRRMDMYLDSVFGAHFLTWPMATLLEIKISHLGKRKIIFKMPFWGDILVPWRVNFLGNKVQTFISGFHWLSEFRSVTLQPAVEGRHTFGELPPSL